MLRLPTLLALVLTLALAACGGSGSTTSTTNTQSSDLTPSEEEQNSELYIALTDAEGDFARYQVDVTQITLTRANGTVIDVLPASTSVDFAQYVEISELLTRVSAPAGRYDSARLSLDFSQADIVVQREDGTLLPANPVSSDGIPLTEIGVDIQFGDRDGFVLIPRRSAQITLDFDLDASNTVVITGDSATVSVDPVLIADAILEEPKPFRVRGLLNSVALEDGTFELDLRPFRVRNGRFGSVNVHVDTDTSFEINGEYIENQEGLNQMAALADDTPLVALGEWDRGNHTFTADEVLAGSSVPWGNSDAVRGTVIQREGNSVMVQGATVEFSEGTFTFNHSVSVLLGEGTRIIQARDSQADANSLSVGSAIYVIGDMLDDSNIDASNGIVRIVPSNIAGTVVSASPLAVDLRFINGRRTEVFDFSGTGTSADNDADPRNYEINLGSLNLPLLEEGNPIRAKGWVSDFASAPEDFDAYSVRNASNVSGHLLIAYGKEGAASAVVSLDENGILLDTSEAGPRHHMVFAGVPIDLNEIEAGVPLLAPGGERGVYAIMLDERIIVSTYYSRFLELLTDALNEGSRVVRVDANGYYSSESNIVSSKRIRVRLTAGVGE